MGMGFNFPEFREQEHLTAGQLNDIVGGVLNAITGGEELLVERTGNNISIKLDRERIIGGGGGTDHFAHVSTFSELPAAGVQTTKVIGYVEDEQQIYHRVGDDWLYAQRFLPYTGA